MIEARTCRAASTMTPASCGSPLTRTSMRCIERRIKYRAASGMAAQQTVKVAIAVAEMAAAKRAFRAVIELVIDTAVIGAIGTPREILVGAMIAKSGRQIFRYLPIHADRQAARRRDIRRARETRRGPPKASQENEG